MSIYQNYKKQEANRNTSLFGDSIDAFQAGAAESVSGMANFVGWESAAKRLQEVADSQYETMTEASQTALAKRMINDDLSMGEGMTDARTWLLQGMKLTGNLATTAIPGGVVGKAVSAGGRAMAGAKSLQATSALARGSNVGTNMALNIASAGGMLGQQSEQAINELDFEDLKDSPAFQNLVKEIHAEGGASDFEVLNQARSTLAKQANEAIKRDPTMMVINGVFGTLGDQALGKVMSSGLGKTLKAQIGKSMVAEGGTEAVQGGAEQYRQNVGINEQAETQLFEPSEGVAANALESGVIGAVAGGALGAPGHGVKKLRQRSFEKQIEQKIPQQTIEQLRAAGYTDADIKNTLWEKTTNAALAHGFDVDQADVMAKNYLATMFDNGPTADQRAQAEDAQQAEQQPAQQPQQSQQPQPEQQGPSGRYQSTAQGALHNDANNLIGELNTMLKQAREDGDQQLAQQLGQDMSRLMGGRDRVIKDITDSEGNVIEAKFDAQGREAYLNALRRTAENYFPEQAQQSEQPKAPQQEQMFDQETGEVVTQEPALQNPQTVQQDQTALADSIRRGDLGFVDEAAQQDAQFREGLRRAMDISPAAVLQVAELRKSGQMNQNQAISALQRIINSVEITGIDQRQIDGEELTMRNQAARERNAQRVQYEREGGTHQPNVEETPEFKRRQAELLKGRQQQEFTTGQQGQSRPNGERDVSPLATGIENQFEANAPQVEFDRWSQVQEGDQSVDQRDYDSPYTQNPQTTELEQTTIFQPRQQEREQVRYDDPAPTAEEYLNQNRGQRGGLLQGELGEQRAKGNARQQKKANKKMSAKRQAIYERITQSDPLDTNEVKDFSTGYQPNAAMLEAFEALSVTQDQPTVEDVSQRLDQLESDGVIDAEDKQAILEQEQPTTEEQQRFKDYQAFKDENQKEANRFSEIERPLAERYSNGESNLIDQLNRLWDQHAEASRKANLTFGQYEAQVAKTKLAETTQPTPRVEPEAKFENESTIFTRRIKDMGKNLPEGWTPAEWRDRLAGVQNKAKGENVDYTALNKELDQINDRTTKDGFTPEQRQQREKYGEDNMIYTEDYDTLTAFNSAIDEALNESLDAAIDSADIDNPTDVEIVNDRINQLTELGVTPTNEIELKRWKNAAKNQPESAQVEPQAEQTPEQKQINFLNQEIDYLRENGSDDARLNELEGELADLQSGKSMADIRRGAMKSVPTETKAPAAKKPRAKPIKLGESINGDVKRLSNYQVNVYPYDEASGLRGRPYRIEQFPNDNKIVMYDVDGKSKQVWKYGGKDGTMREAKEKANEAASKENQLEIAALKVRQTDEESNKTPERKAFNSRWDAMKEGDRRDLLKKAFPDKSNKLTLATSRLAGKHLGIKEYNKLEPQFNKFVDDDLKKAIKHELDVELKRMWAETPENDKSALSRLTDIRKRFNKVMDGEGTAQDLAWAKEWTDDTAKGQTSPEKAKAQEPIAKARFAEAKTGKSDNPRYQAWLDTLEQADLDEINSNADYMAWIGSYRTEFARINDIQGNTFTPAQDKAFDAYLREQADNNLSDRVAKERGPNKKAPAAKKAKAKKATGTKAMTKTMSNAVTRKLGKISTAEGKLAKAEENMDKVEALNSTERSGVDMSNPKVKAAQRRVQKEQASVDKAIGELGELYNRYLDDQNGDKAEWDKHVEAQQGHLESFDSQMMDEDYRAGREEAEPTKTYEQLSDDLDKAKTAIEFDEVYDDNAAALKAGTITEEQHIKTENGRILRMKAEGLAGLQRKSTLKRLAKENYQKMVDMVGVPNGTDDAKYLAAMNDLRANLINMEVPQADVDAIVKGLDIKHVSSRQTALKKVAEILGEGPEPTPPKGTKKDGYTRTNTAPRGSEGAKPKDLKGYTKAILVEENRPTTKDATLEVAKGLRDDHDAIIAELNSMTMPNIKKMMGTYWAMMNKDFKKDRLVKSAYDSLMKNMLFSITDGAFITTSGQSGVELGDYVVSQIEAVSNEKFNEIQARKEEQRKAEEAEAARKKEALADPKTLQDFVAYARNKGDGIESFTPEQLKRYDELVSENKLAQLEQQRKAAAEVKAVNGDVPYQLAETTHSKLNEPRYVVQLTGERMGKYAFKELATRARQLGGNYINAMQAKRYNTIDGFQFANVDDRNNFAKLLDGETVNREANQQRQLEKKQDNRVTKLKEMAGATEAKADEVLNQDRKTNTAKRASDAARVMDNAYADQYDARLLRAIAEATEAGDIQVLSNLSQKVQLDELNSIVGRIVWEMPEAQREKFAYRNERGNWILKPETKLDDILYWAKYPVPESRPDRLNRLADDMESVKGYKQAAKKIRSKTKNAGERDLIQMTGRDWEATVAKIRDFARKNKDAYVAENIAEMFKREDRLNRMGIDGPAMLRYVLREKSMIEKRISTDKPVETPVTKLTKKVEDTIRANRNAYNDFFPTDNDTLADQVIDEADIQPGMKVLEPSAGMGHLADKIKATGADLDVGEYANTMAELLSEKGHNVVSSDFLDYNPGPIYDRIVMNPPFSHDADVHHVTHALTMLKPGGRLVAITSSMAGDRSNSANKNFREYLDTIGAVERPNPEGSFKNSINPTSVNTKTIIIDKPDVDENLPNFDDIRFSQNAVLTEPAKGMKATDVEQAAQKWKDGYAGLKAANVQVVQSQADLQNWVQTNPDATVKAVWMSQDNRVILVADNLDSPQDVRKAMRHELIGHNGVFGNLDPEQSEILTNQVMNLRKNKKLASIFAEVDASYKKAPDYVKAEEVVARLAEQETGKLRQVADRVMAFVMGAMRRSGFLAADKINLAEVRNMINGADKYLRRKDGTMSLPDVVRFSQSVDQVQDIRQEYMAVLEGNQQSLLNKILRTPWNMFKRSNVIDSVKNGGLGLLTMRQLVDVAQSKLGSDFHKHMKTYLDEVNQMMADEGNAHQNIMNVFEPLDKWRRKNPELADRTFEAMHEFTLDNVDPFQDYQDLTPELKKAKAVLQEKMRGRSGESKAKWMKEVNEIDAQIKYEPKRKKNLEQAKQKLNQLPPEAQKVIKDIRDHYTTQREDMYSAMMERAADLAMNGGLKSAEMLKIRLDNEIAKKSFYVPLTRFGDYFIDGIDENGERVFTMYQTENEMLEAKQKLVNAGYEVKSGKSIDNFAGLDTISSTVVKKMFEHLETTTMSEKARDAMKDNVYQMYLESLPSRSIRKQFIHRKGVAGFSKNALQALADQGAKQAKQLAKFKLEDALAKSIAGLSVAYDEQKMLPEAEGEDRVFTARFMDEMTKRNEWVMNPKRAAWASNVTGFGFFWMIGASPASALINLTQNVQVAIPVIGSKFGVGATSKVMAGLTGDFFKSFKGAHADMAKRREYGILGSTILTGEERAAMKQAIAMGVIDTTQAHDLLDLAENQPTKLTDRKAKIMRGVGFLFHHAEVLNREVTYMTAYRLAKQNGDSHQNAMEYATKATWDSHFDYGSLNRARFMQGDVAAVALQFKQYSQNMTYYLFSNFFKAFTNKKISAEERTEARKQLLGTMAATFLFGGLGALPVTTIAAIANMAHTVFGDEDDPWNAEVEMREILKEWFGRDMANGIYYGMGTMVGAPNISGRIEIDPMSLWVRPSDAIGARAQFGDYTKQMLGPTYSTVYSMAGGLDYIFRDQKYQKGFEAFMPKWIRDVSKTVRYLEKSGQIQNNNGDIIVSDLSPLEYTEQLLGFTPNRYVIQNAENRAIKGYERQAIDRRKLLLNGMWLAYRNKDSESIKNLWKKINKYNQSEWGRARPITQKTVSQSLKSRIRSQANARKGLHFNAKYSNLIDTKFAQD